MYMVHLATGMEAPHFELPDADMKPFVLTSQLGKKNVVLYFYSKDNTPGCTMEANEFSGIDDDLAKLDTIVVGISRDDCITHASFRDKYGLSVLLLSDPDARVCKRYGVLVEKESGHDKASDGAASHLNELKSAQTEGSSGGGHFLPQHRDDGHQTCHEERKRADGHKKFAVQRSTFVIDKHGVLRYVMYGVHAHGHAQEIYNLIKGLK